MRGLLHSAADTKGEVSPSRRIGLAIDGVPEPLQSAMLIPLFENSHHCQLLTTQPSKTSKPNARQISLLGTATLMPYFDIVNS